MTLAGKLVNNIHSECQGDTKESNQKKGKRKDENHKVTSKEFFIGTDDKGSTKDTNDNSTEGNTPRGPHSEDLSEEGFKKRPVVTHKITPGRKEVV